MIGKTISHYKIIEKLGSGGMGVVYKAEDTKLDRFVALKFLPKNLNQAEEEKRRFIHEAKAASALDHNNICNIHEIDETKDGELFIAMALYEGQTLDKKIEHGPLKLDEAVDIAVQILEGLAKAHGKEIVHRDLKPANVMLTEDGVVKILDFGLAKLRGLTKLTKEGTTLGTAAYMSPEQSQGQEVDQRTDIFSLGVLIYEMVTGQQPFKGDYEQAVLYSIMNEDPEPLTGLRTGVPLYLERAVLKCLEKAADERYQSARELLVDLKKLSKGLDVSHGKPVTAASATEGKQAGGKSKWGLYALGAIGIASLVALFIYLQKDPKPIRLTNPRKITQAIGKEHEPTWSPDGSKIVYTSDQTGRRDVWIKQLAGGEPVNITKDMANGSWRPSWSPDGSQIAFLSHQATVRQVWVIPAIGGTAARVDSTSFRSNPVWSADGTRLAHVVKDNSGVPRAEIYSFSTRETRTVALPGTEFERTNLSWSPQGDTFAYIDGVTIDGLLRIVRLAGGFSFQITTKDRSVRSTQWSADGRLLYFSSNRGGTRDLWQVKLNAQGNVDGKPEQISNGLGMDDFAFSRDHKKIAYARGETSSNLWRVAIPKPDAPAVQWTSAKQLTFESSTIGHLELSRDGKRIYFTSTRSGNRDIWSMAVDGGELRQLTTNPGVDTNISFSPEGGTIAFRSLRSGNSEIWIMPASGEPARQITHDQSPKFWPRWSPDGQTLAYVAQDSASKTNIWVIPAEGGEVRQVTTAQKNLYNLLWWPDSQSLVTASRKPLGILRFAITGGPPELLAKPGFAFDDLRWSADKQHIFFIRNLKTMNIWSLSVADRSLRQLTDFSGRPGILGREFATDGTYFYFTWVEETGDIWVMDVETER